MALAWLAAVVAFVGCLAALVLLTPLVMFAIVSWGARSADGSLGDSAGWATLIASPVFLPLYAAAASLAAFAAYRKAADRRDPPDEI